MGAPQLGDRPVYDPVDPVRGPHRRRRRARRSGGRAARDVDVFRVADPELAGYAVLDFDGFDAWYEEDDLNLAHPRDPFHPVDIVHSSRHVRVDSRAGCVAESTSPYLLFEPPLPVRYYFGSTTCAPTCSEPSELTTVCAYKGEATYFSRGERPTSSGATGTRRGPELQDELLVARGVAHTRDAIPGRVGVTRG